MTEERLETQGEEQGSEGEDPTAAKLRELEAQNSQLREKLEEEKRLNDLLSSDTPPAPRVRHSEEATPEGSVVPAFATFDESQRQELSQWVPIVTRQVASQVMDVVQTAFANEKAERTFRSKFFKKYPDLQEYEEEVDHEAAKLASEIGNRKVDQDKAMAELARRTKSHIEALKRKFGGDSPPQMASGSSSEPQPSPRKKEDAPLSEEARLDDYLEEQKRYKESRLVRTNPQK